MAKRKGNRLTFKMRYEVEVRAKNGKLLSREARECKSLLTNWMKWLATFLSCASGGAGTSQSMNDYTGTSRTVPYTAQQYQGFFGARQAPAANQSYGIIVGSGDTAVDPSDYFLATIISHGTGSGQLYYNAQSTEAVQVTGNESSCRATRTFSNNSGGTITVKEIGWVFVMKDSAGTDRYFLDARDVLASPQNVPDGATLTVRYTYSVVA